MINKSCKGFSNTELKAASREEEACYYMRNISLFCAKNFPVFKKGERYKIAFTGTHGVGKTTAVNIAHAWVKIFYPEMNTRLVCEVARESILPINEKSTFENQMWMVSKQVEQELFLSTKYDVLICDRTVYDYIAYICSLFGGNYELLDAYKEYMESYTKIYYIPIDEKYELQDDGIRSIDPVWRKEIDSLIYNNLRNKKFNNTVFLESNPLTTFG